MSIHGNQYKFKAFIMLSQGIHSVRNCDIQHARPRSISPDIKLKVIDNLNVAENQYLS